MDTSVEVKIQATKDRLIKEATMLVDVRRVLVNGGFTTEQAYDLIDSVVARPHPEHEEEEE